MAGRDVIVSVNVIRKNANLVVQTQTIKKEEPYVRAGVVNTILGKDGSLIYSAAGVPLNTLGVYTDLYIDTNTPNNFYQKDVTNVWVLKGSLKGDDGKGIVSFEIFDVQEKTKTYRLLYTDATYVDINIIDGNDGADGLTPYIGMNGNWWIGDVDQNIKAEGVDGVSPTIGLNGNWYIGTTDTGVKAAGTDGTNGLDGTDGVGISNITKTGTILNVDEYTITFTDASTFLFYVTNGLNGADGTDGLDGTNGTDGRGIVSIIKTSTVGVVDTYTITYSDTTTSTFEVTNADTSTLLKLDQTIPQTLTQSPKINDLVAGRMCYVDANKQLKPIDAYYDSVNKRIGVGAVPNYKFVASDDSTVQDSITGINREKCISVQGSGGAYLMARDKTNAIEGMLGTSTLGVVFFGAMTNHPLHVRTWNITRIFVGGNALDGNVCIGGATDPKSKLDVRGGIRCGDDTAAASADKVGTIRQRDVNNNTLLEFCKNVAGVYEWEKINDKLSLDQTVPQTLTQSPKITDLVATKLMYVDANNQIKTINAFYDAVKDQIQIGNVTVYNNTYGLAVAKNIITNGEIRIGGGSAILAASNLNFILNGAYVIKNSNTGANSAIEIWTKNIKAATFTPTQGLKVVSGIQCGDDTAAASADKVGTTRYRATANASYVEMCMQVTANSYSWITIVTNTW